MDEPCRTSFQKTLEVADCAIAVEVIWGKLDSGGWLEVQEAGFQPIPVTSWH